MQSPTLSQHSRVLLVQILVSHRWTLDLGDIKGAFMEAGPLDPRYRPLFAHVPSGGIPSVPPDAGLLTGNVYGQNDAPAAWYRTFDHEACGAGWTRSRFDPCLYTLRTSGPESTLVGVMGVHVDDIAIGGMGPLYQQSIEQLRRRFPFRKWRTGAGEFCGAFMRFLQSRSYYQRGFDVSILLCRRSQASVCAQGSQSRKAFGSCSDSSVARYQR